MRVLLDHNVHPRFAQLLTGHDVSHTHNLGWGELLNGDLISTAEEAGFDAMITADKNLEYQQNLKGRRLGIIVLNARRITWPHIEPLAGRVNEALSDLRPGSFIKIGPDSAEREA